MKKAAFFICSIIVNLMVSGGDMVKYQVKEEMERQYLKGIGIEVPSLAEIEENSYIYRYIMNLEKEKDC